MKALRRALKVDLHRAVFSRTFLLTVLLLMGWLFFNLLFYTENVWTRVDIVTQLNSATSGAFGLAELLLAIATVPYAWSYLQDRNSGFEAQALQRVGFRAYGFSKILSVGLSAFLAAITSIALFLGILYARGLDVLPSHPLSESGYFLIIPNGGVFLYYLVHAVVTGLGAAMAAVVALAVSTMVPNVYVALMSPLLWYYIYQVLCSIFFLSNAFSLTVILFEQYFANPWFNFLWACVFLLTMTALFGRLFLWRLRKERGK